MPPIHVPRVNLPPIQAVPVILLKSHIRDPIAFTPDVLKPTLSNMVGPFANNVYRRILLAQVLSLLGSGLTTVALGLLAFQLAGKDAGAVLGIALTLKMVAYVGAAPVAAALAAKLPRRPFLIGLDLSRALLVGLLPFVTQIWQIYVLVFAFQAFSAAFTPTFQALIPDILTDEDDYTQALSFSRLAYDMEALLSPLLAGLLLSFVSYHFLFAGTAIGFIASAVLVFSVTLPGQRQAVMQLSFRRRLTRGIWIYLATPRLRGLLALYVAVAAATSMVIVNTVPRVKGTLALGDEMVALHFAAYGVGSMLIALTLPRLLRGLSPRPVMLAGSTLLGIGMILAATGPGLIAGLGIWLLLGIGASLIQTPTGLMLTRSCHDVDRAAVFAAQFTLSHVCWLLAYPLAGFLGAWTSLNQTFAVIAVITIAANVAALYLWPRSDPNEIEHVHHKLEHEHAFGDPAHHDPSATDTSKPVRHRHEALRHTHVYFIDDHHTIWPK